MSSFFKKILEDDAKQVFLNLDEFSEEVNIDGVVMPVIWGEHSETGEGFHRVTVDSFGLSVESLTIYVAEGAMLRPVPNQRMWIDGERWDVMKASPQQGLICIELFRNIS